MIHSTDKVLAETADVLVRLRRAIGDMDRQISTTRETVTGTRALIGTMRAPQASPSGDGIALAFSTPAAME